jgi:formyltetrahydrofolate deformylase
MVSQEDHYLSDLLYRWRAGEICIEIPCLISNHDTLRTYVEWHGIPFIYLSAYKSNKVEHFQIVEEQIAAAKSDVTVLAKHMYIIRESPCELCSGRIINIHHSFPPLFISARPYRQSAARCVKQISNNYHYVTPDLDAGRNCEGGCCWPAQRLALPASPIW